MRAVYAGYEEKYMSGKQMKKHFKGCYETFGRNHKKISNRAIDFDGKYRKVLDSTRYRLFINKSFCIVFDDKTDEQKDMFGYTREKPSWAKD